MQLEKCLQFEGAATPLPSTEMSCLASRAHGVVDEMHQKEIPALDPVLGLMSCMHAPVASLPFLCPKCAPICSVRRLDKGRCLKMEPAGRNRLREGLCPANCFICLMNNVLDSRSRVCVSWILPCLILPAAPRGRYSQHSHFTDGETLTSRNRMTYSARQNSKSGGLAPELMF